MNICDNCGKKVVRASGEDGCSCMHLHRFSAAVEFEKKEAADGSWSLQPIWHGAVEEGLYGLMKIENDNEEEGEG